MIPRNWQVARRFSVQALLIISLGLPILLFAQAVMTSREMDQMRSIYLRERVATVAARLEVMPSETLESGDFEALYESEPALVEIRIFRPADASDGAALDTVRAGRELYHTENALAGGHPVYRAYIPFHLAGTVSVARIDLSLDAPDLILAHARHSAVMTVASGIALLLLTLAALWSMRRAARLERARIETERLTELGTLSAVLAHEIRNPLGTIKGFAQLAREGADPRQAKQLDTVIRESRRLEGLVNSLLLYGRPVKPVITKVEWRPIADELETYVRNLAGARPIRFILDSGIEEIATDGNMLKQALLNLVRNSVEAIRDGEEGEVRVRVRAEARNGASITVEDDGPGIPDEVRAKLFSPFVTGKASGTGLGLSISKKLVEAMGGALRITSREPRGTIAEIRLYGTNSHH